MKKLILLFALIFSSLGFSNEELFKELLHKEVELAPSFIEPFENGMELNGVEIIISPSIGVGLPILSVDFVPEIEMIFSRIEE